MRTANWLVIALKACALVLCLTACNTIGIAEPGRSGFAEELASPGIATEFIPLFAPLSDVAIDPVNASFLMPSSMMNFRGTNGIVWLPGGKGALLAGENSLTLLSTPTLDASPQAGLPETLQTIASNTPSLLSVAQEAAIVAWVSEGKEINVMDATTEMGEPVFTQSISPVTGLALAPNGDHLAYATFSRDIFVQELGERVSAKSWTTPAWLANLSYSPDGTRLAGADLTSFTLYFLDVSNGQVVSSQEWSGSATSALYGVYLSPDWTQAAWVVQSAVQLMKVASGETGPMLLHQSVVNAIAWSPDSRVIATAAAVMIADDVAPAVFIWDANSGGLINTLVQPAAVQDLTFSTDGRQLAILNINGGLQTWSVGR